MSEYNTGNPVPSIDPRDLDDNATIFDKLLNEETSSVSDRLGQERKTWHQMEIDAEALVSPNVAALAGLAGAADRLPYFTGPNAMALAVFTAQARQLLDDTSSAAMLVTLGAAPVATPTFTGVPAAPTAAPGTNTTQLATTAMVQAEIANKRSWTAYTPTITAAAGTFTSASATGKYMVAFGICHLQVTITIATQGTGTLPVFTLPFAALAGSSQMPLLARETVQNGKLGCAAIDPTLLKAVCADYINGNLVTTNGCVIAINDSYPVA